MFFLYASNLFCIYPGPKLYFYLYSELAPGRHNTCQHFEGDEENIKSVASVQHTHPMPPLSEQQKIALRAHAKFQTPCHMQSMRAHMINGDSFSEAHRKAALSKPKSKCKCKCKKKKKHTKPGQRRY